MKIIDYQNFDLMLDEKTSAERLNHAKPIFRNDKFYCSLRKFQDETLSDYKEHQHNYVMINAPTGCGKSTLLLAMINVDTMDFNSKTIIIAPQISIVSGFNECNYIDGDQEISLNIECLDHNHIGTKTQSKTKHLKDFLERSNNLPARNRVISCTYNTLCICYEQLLSEHGKEKVKELFKDVNLCVDEAHHLLDSENIDNQFKTRITEIMYSLMDNGSKIKIATATPFRGDGKILMTEDRFNSFTAYRHSFYDFLIEDCQTLKGIKVSSIFYPYDMKYPEAIKEIFEKHGFKDTIIFIPKRRTKYAYEDNGVEGKVREVNEIVSALGNLAEQQGISININNLVFGNRKITSNKIIKTNNILKKRQNKFLSDNTMIPKDETIEIIIALDMFREGSDFIPLERLISVGNMTSATRTMQGLGRVTRDYYLKEVSEVFFTMNNDIAVLHGDEAVKAALTENFNNLHKIMDLTFDFIPNSVNTSIQRGDGSTIVGNPWEMAIPFKYKIVQNKIRARVHQEINSKWFIQDKNEHFIKIIKEEIANAGVTDENMIKPMIRSYRKQWHIKNIAMQTHGLLSRDEISDEIMDNTDIFAGLTEYSSKVFGLNGFSDVQRIQYPIVHDIIMTEQVMKAMEAFIKEVGV